MGGMRQGRPTDICMYRPAYCSITSTEQLMQRKEQRLHSNADSAPNQTLGLHDAPRTSSCQRDRRRHRLAVRTTGLPEEWRVGETVAVTCHACGPRTQVAPPCPCSSWPCSPTPPAGRSPAQLLVAGAPCRAPLGARHPRLGRPQPQAQQDGTCRRHCCRCCWAAAGQPASPRRRHSADGVVSGAGGGGPSSVQPSRLGVGGLFFVCPDEGTVLVDGLPSLGAGVPAPRPLGPAGGELPHCYSHHRTQSQHKV